MLTTVALLLDVEALFEKETKMNALDLSASKPLHLYALAACSHTCPFVNCMNALVAIPDACAVSQLPDNDGMLTSMGYFSVICVCLHGAVI